MNSHPLTPKQSEAICHLLEASSVAEAARLAGVARSTLYQWLKQPAFGRELAIARRAEHQARLNALTELLPQALKALSKLMDSEDHRVALKAACAIMKACQTLADKSASGGEAASTPLLEDGPKELDGSLLELTQNSVHRLLNGTLEPKAAQMLPSYLRLLERLKAHEEDQFGQQKDLGAEEEENMLLAYGLLERSYKADTSGDPFLASFYGEAKQFMLERGWSEEELDRLVEESRSKGAPRPYGAPR